MLSKSHSVAGPPAGNFSSGKKKKAPPRPPPPTAASNTVRPSQSFGSGNELQSQKISSFGQRTTCSVDAWGSSSTNRSGGSDLIDFSTPDLSTNVGGNGAGGGSPKSKEPADYMYRVGASIFYIRSQLKNPAPSSQSANPFSPPRPSAQAMLASPAKHGGQGQNRYSNVPSQLQQSQSSGGSIKYNPTIIKRPNENNNTIKPAFVGGSNFNNDKFGGEGSLRSSSGSSDWSDYSQTSSQPQPPQQYGNIPIAWDEPPVQHREPQPQPQAPKVFPTIIKPPLASKPSLLPKPGAAAAAGSSVNRSPVPSTITNPAWKNVASEIQLKNVDSSQFQERNYYDDPPGSDFDEEEDELDDSIVSPPMPSEPPPPPPPELALNNWGGQTTTMYASQQDYVQSSQSNQRTETDRAYALALYDYLSDVEGDLPLQVGDLVYLIKKIDEEWLFGHCAGVEGIFPCNYVNVVLPLPDEDSVQQVKETGRPRSSEIATPQIGDQVFFADALYTFDAEADGDLSLRPGDMVKIFGRLNEDWLYGEVAGKVGQFPTTFVDPVPSDLPIIPTGS